MRLPMERSVQKEKIEQAVVHNDILSGTPDPCENALKEVVFVSVAGAQSAAVAILIWP